MNFVTDIFLPFKKLRVFKASLFMDYFANGSMKLLVPFDSYVYLMNTEIDFSDDLLNGGFKFGNPQANRTCGCGTSFSV